MSWIWINKIYENCIKLTATIFYIFSKEKNSDKRIQLINYCITVKNIKVYRKLIPYIFVHECELIMST